MSKYFANNSRCPANLGFVWLTPKEAAAKIICSVSWLLQKGINEPHKIPYRPWGRTFRFIAKELDEWAGSCSPVVERKKSFGRRERVAKNAAVSSPQIAQGHRIKQSYSVPGYPAGNTWLTPEQSAHKLKVSVKWLKSTGIKKYGIPYKKLGKTYRFTVEELDAFPGFVLPVAKPKPKNDMVDGEGKESSGKDSLLKVFNSGFHL